MRTLAVIFIVILIWGAGLLAFAARVDRSTPPPTPPTADGVVALTGPSDARISTALDLLQAGAAKRLLISGVSREVTRSELQTVTGANAVLYNCCVDLGFTAANTLGNARETAQWARAHGYHTLILVTADYHMPRARLELSTALPDAKLYPFPVATPELAADRWWRTGGGVERMALEYCKYLAVLAREAILGLGTKPTARAPAG